MADIQRVVLNRSCPQCGYLMPQVQIEALRVSVKCPRGCLKTTNEFVPVIGRRTGRESHDKKGANVPRGTIR